MSEGTNRRESNGYSGTSLLLTFVGGALAGAAVAYLAQSENRARVRAFARRAQRRAAHLPGAVREASHAAKEAFAEAYQGEGKDNGKDNGDAPAIASKPRRRAEAEDA